MARYTLNEYYAIAYTVVNFRPDNSVGEVWTNVMGKWCHDKAHAQECGRVQAKIEFPSDQYVVHAVAVTRLK